MDSKMTRLETLKVNKIYRLNAITPKKITKLTLKIIEKTFTTFILKNSCRNVVNSIYSNKYQHDLFIL